MTTPDYLVVIDFESTCQCNNYSFFNEIIEWPALLICTRTKSIISEFHHYVKPALFPTLTPFCTELTGITQAQVDSALPFVKVLKLFQNWLDECNVIDSDTQQIKAAVVFDGIWDVRKFITNEFGKMKEPRPMMDLLFSKWIDLRCIFRACFGERVNPNIENMLSVFAMKFEGRPHCGLADTRNMARIVLRMLSLGCIFQFTCMSSFLYGIYTTKQERKGSWKEDAVFQAAAREIRSINKVLICDKRYNPQAVHNRHQVYTIRGGLAGVVSAAQKLPFLNRHIASEVICTVHTTKKSTLTMNRKDAEVILQTNIAQPEMVAEDYDEASAQAWDGHMLTNEQLVQIGPKIVSFKKVSLRGRTLAVLCDALTSLEQKTEGCVVMTLLLPRTNLLAFDLTESNYTVEDVTAKFAGPVVQPPTTFYGQCVSFLDDLHRRAAHVELSKYLPLEPNAEYHPADLTPPTTLDDQHQWAEWRRALLTRRKQLQNHKMARKKQLVAAQRKGQYSRPAPHQQAHYVPCGNAAQMAPQYYAPVDAAYVQQRYAAPQNRQTHNRGTYVAVNTRYR